ncbi:glycosyltransferase family 10 [Chromobacterium sp. S0633]|uniref:glycosyltransferase family 10 domain-containing protein n=1 Tax=Chromobacterium sp. S0633 TaxID=2957805 RepID=UPI0020A0E1B0|nr:glycosyltransferase family 10 [Chromobacterium sp. S0633]MCP1289063.1 glycosyltransferase family 10 [Chromobacterium sp. S0633]
MISALLYGAGENNDVFSPSSHLNRDNCNHPFFLLKEKLLKFGIDLNTWDTPQKYEFFIEIHINARKISRSKNARHYLLNMETPLIDRNNSSIELINQFNIVFCWQNHTHARNFKKINYSQNLQLPDINGFKNRNNLCCMIAGNKTTQRPDARSLYPERIKAIRWFQCNAPLDFRLYGTGWNLPAMRHGKLGRIYTKLQGMLGSYFNAVYFPAYKGRIESKSTVLLNSKFSICYENVTGFNGYITEKIFDSFFSGCVPIYHGAPDIASFIPSTCYIDRTQFNSYPELYQYIKNMPEREFLDYQTNIASFLSSDLAYSFSSECFANTISEEIAHDLELAAQF